MANPMKGESEVALEDGRKLKMVFNANAWIETEEVLGRPTPEIIDELQSGRASLKTQRAVIYGGLQKHHPEITLEEAGDILVEAAQAMAAGLAGGMPQAEEGAAADANAGPPKRKRGAGTSS